MKCIVKNLFIFFTIFVLVGCCTKDSTNELSPQIDKLLSYWNTGNFEGIENVLHPEFEMRMSPKYESEKGIEAFKESVSKTREAYPEFNITIEEGVYGENIAAGRWTIHATSKRGNKMNIMGISMLHFADGKIKDEWISSNDLLWMEQLGYTLLPPEKDEISKE